jgi:hypothetical protein
VRAVGVQGDDVAQRISVVGVGAVEDEILSEESFGHDLAWGVTGRPPHLEPPGGVGHVWEPALQKGLRRAVM